MRRREYLSPSAIACWKLDPEEFYKRYLCDLKPQYEPQTQPMSVGSAFDAYVKSHLHHALYGSLHADAAKFEFETIFESQVEPHNRDWARENGKYVFEQYKAFGALKDLLIELNLGSKARFEFELKGTVSGPKGPEREGVESEIQGVTLLGKPDLHFINKHGCSIVHDWKVNGYCGKSNTSPKAGYVRLRQAGGLSGKSHKDAQPMYHQGTTINAASRLEYIDEDWAQQLSIYSWLLGEPIGGDQVFSIDQIVGKGVPDSKPILRVAEHRLICTPAWQHRLFADIADIWQIINSDHIFRDLSFEDSKAKCDALDAQGTIPLGALGQFLASGRER